MINHKYHSLFALCLAGLLLAIFAPRKMREYYPTPNCTITPGRGYHVDYYVFDKHTWLKYSRVALPPMIEDATK